MHTEAAGTIGYILKAYPRTSETFILNEMHLLERRGLQLHIFSVKTLTGQQRHGVVDRIAAPVTYLPETTALDEQLFPVWLWRNLPRFARAHGHVLRARPLAYLLTLLEVLRFSLLYRTGPFAWPRKVFLKEFLQAGFIAHELQSAPHIRHLHAHFCHGSTTIAMFASRLSGVPYSFTAHAKDVYKRDLNPGNLLRIKLHRARFVVTCTRANHDFLARHCSRPVPIHTIYHGLDPAQFAPAGSREAPAAPPVILAVGRIVEKKGFGYLVEACRLLRAQGYTFRCRIVGGADAYSETLQRLIAEARLADTIEVQPAVTQEALSAIYAASTIFALPCQILDSGDRDGIPNVLVEAMAMALPVVSTNISGIPELIEQRRNGLLVPEQDAGALAGALATLLDSPALRHQLGIAARATVVRSFDAWETTNALHALFMAALQPAMEAPRVAYAAH